MEKKTYYVRTGNIREVVVASTPIEAVRGALARSNEKELSPGLLTICSPSGFEQCPNADLLFITENELRALRYNPEAFLKGFDMTEEQWRAYRKLKTGIETFQGLSEPDEL